MDPPIGDPLRLIATGGLQSGGQGRGDPYLAYQSPFALDGVDLAVTARKFALQGGAGIGCPFLCAAQGQQFMRPQACGMGDLGGEAVAVVLG